MNQYQIERAMERLDEEKESKAAVGGLAVFILVFIICISIVVGGLIDRVKALEAQQTHEKHP